MHFPQSNLPYSVLSLRDFSSCEGGWSLVLSVASQLFRNGTVGLPLGGRRFGLEVSADIVQMGPSKTSFFTDSFAC